MLSKWFTYCNIITLKRSDIYSMHATCKAVMKFACHSETFCFGITLKHSKTMDLPRTIYLKYIFSIVNMFVSSDESVIKLTLWFRACHITIQMTWYCTDCLNLNGNLNRAQSYLPLWAAHSSKTHRCDQCVSTVCMWMCMYESEESRETQWVFVKTSHSESLGDICSPQKHNGSLTDTFHNRATTCSHQ